MRVLSQRGGQLRDELGGPDLEDGVVAQVADRQARVVRAQTLDRLSRGQTKLQPHVNRRGERAFSKTQGGQMFVRQLTVGS